MRDDWVVAEKRPPEVLGALPRRRPHRRSDKRAARPAAQGASASVTPITGERSPGAPAAKPRTASAKPRTASAKPRTAAGAKPRAAAGAAAAGAAAAKPRAAAGAKRRATAAKPKLRQPAQPGGTPATPRPDRTPAREPDVSRPDILGTAVQAAAELAEIGLAVSARALRSAVSRLPRP